MINKKKGKRYYFVGENVYIKDLNTTGKVKELNIKTLSVVLVVKNGDATTEITRSFELIDKLRIKKTKSNKATNVIQFAKVNPNSNAKIPSKREEDGCYDVYASFEEEEILIMPQQTKLVPTGIASAFDSKYRINCKRERGSTGKYSLAVLSGQIDSGYNGEWFIALNNAGSVPIVISKKYLEVHINESGWIFYPYTKAICQAAVEIVPEVEIEEVDYSLIASRKTERGMGKIGSSGK